MFFIVAAHLSLHRSQPASGTKKRVFQPLAYGNIIYIPAVSAEFKGVHDPCYTITAFLIITIPRFLRHHAWLFSQCTVAWIQYPRGRLTTTRPENDHWTLIRPKNCYTISLWGQLKCSLANFNRFCTFFFFFFQQWCLTGASWWSLHLIKRRLTGIPQLQVHCWSSLIFLEELIGWIFAILTLLSSVTVVANFLPYVSGFCCHFKAFEIILAEHPVICCTSLYVFPSPINFLIKLRCSSEQCLERPVLYFITMCETFASFLS